MPNNNVVVKASTVGRSTFANAYALLKNSKFTKVQQQIIKKLKSNDTCCLSVDEFEVLLSTICVIGSAKYPCEITLTNSVPVICRKFTKRKRLHDFNAYTPVVHSLFIRDNELFLLYDRMGPSQFINKAGKTIKLDSTRRTSIDVRTITQITFNKNLFEIKYKRQSGKQHAIYIGIWRINNFCL